MELLIILGVWIGIGWLCSSISDGKGRGRGVGWALGLGLGLIGLVIVALITSKPK